MKPVEVTINPTIAPDKTLPLGWHTITLPSNVEIGIRPLLYKEARAVNNAVATQLSTVLKQIVHEATTFNVNEKSLLWPDLQDIMLWWRANSMPNPEFEMNYDCPHCGRADNEDIIEPSYLSVEPNDAYNQMTEFKDSQGTTWFIGYPCAFTWVDTLALEDETEREERQLCAKIYDKDRNPVNPESFVEYLGNMPNKDALELAETVGTFDGTHTLEMPTYHEATCPACGKQTYISFETDVDFFFARS